MLAMKMIAMKGVFFSKYKYCLAGWLAGWLVGWLVGWLAGWGKYEL